MGIESEILVQTKDVFMKYIPQLTVSILLFFFGVLLSSIFSEVIKKMYKFSKMDAFLSKLNLSTTFLGADIGNLIADISKWFIIIAFLQEAMRTLSLQALNNVLGDILAMIPLFTKAGLVFYVAILIGEYFRNQIRQRKFIHNELVAVGVYSAIAYIGMVIAVSEIYPAGSQVLNIVLAVVLSAVGFGIALGVGLAVGLGSKDYVSKLVNEYFK